MNLHTRILKAVPEGVWVVSPEGRTLYGNERMAELLGTDLYNLGNMSCFDPLFPSDVEEAQRHFGLQMTGDGRPFDFRLRRIDGSPVWVRISCLPVTDEAGGVTGLLGLFTDISERRRAEDALRESEERFRTMADTAPVMIWISGPDKLCNFFNKPWMEFTGRALEQERGNGWAEGVHPDDLNHCFGTYVSSFDARQDFRMEYRLRRADGEYRWILHSGTPIYRGTEFNGYIGSCVDVTDFKVTEQNLLEYRVQLQRLTGELLTSQENANRQLARELHDVLSQDLAAIELEIHMLRSEVRSDRKLASRLAAIGDKIGRIAADVHQTSRELHPTILEELGLEPALRQECRSFQDRFSIQTRFTMKGEPKRLNGLTKDGHLCLYRVAQESLRNVGKHAPDAKSVRMLLAGDPKGTTLIVSDKGCGFVVDSARKKGGLGLISIEERVRFVGGKLTIHSEPAVGTTIQVFIPST